MNDKVKSKANKRPSPLKNWKDYKDFYESLEDNRHLKDNNSWLNRFEARYSLASKFQGIKADEMSPKTLRGYNAGMKLLLAYTSAELLCKAIGGSILKWKLEDKKLANDLKKMLKHYNINAQVREEDRKDISLFLDKEKAIGLFNDFMENDRHNIRIVATVLRIAMAHGPFSPYAFGLKKASDAALIDDLSNLLLIKCQRKFTKWFKVEKQILKNK